MMPTVNQALAHLTAVSIMKLPLEIIGKPSFWKSPKDTLKCRQRRKRENYAGGIFIGKREIGKRTIKISRTFLISRK